MTFEEALKQYNLLLWKMVHKYKGIHGSEQDDLRQVALIALNDAINKYDESRGHFTTYVQLKISSALRAFINSKKCQQIKVPWNNPDIKHHYENITCTNSEGKDYDHACLTYHDTPYEVSTKEFVDMLSEKEKYVIQNRYCEDVKTYREIAEVLGCTIPNVKHIENKALYVLRLVMDKQEKEDDKTSEKKVKVNKHAVIRKRLFELFMNGIKKDIDYCEYFDQFLEKNKISKRHLSKILKEGFMENMNVHHNTKTDLWYWTFMTEIGNRTIVIGSEKHYKTREECVKSFYSAGRGNGPGKIIKNIQGQMN